MNLWLLYTGHTIDSTYTNDGFTLDHMISHRNQINIYGDNLSYRFVLVYDQQKVYVLVFVSRFWPIPIYPLQHNGQEVHCL